MSERGTGELARRRVRSAALGLLAPLLAALVAVPTTAVPAQAAPAHIVIIMMENHSYGQVIGKASAPYINSLAKSYRTFTQMFATVNGSIEPYEDQTGGNNPERQDPLFICRVGNPKRCRDNLPNIVDQLESAGQTWKAYIQDYPTPGACDLTDKQVGAYVIRHVPWLYYTDINGLNGNSSRCVNLVGLDQLSADISANSLPTYAMVTPNLYAIMHTPCTILPCPPGAPNPVTQGDDFLNQWVPQLLNAGAEVIVTWADGKGTDTSGCCTYAMGGHVPTIVAASGMAHQTVTRQMDTFSILRGIEDAYGFTHLQLADCSCTPSMPL